MKITQLFHVNKSNFFLWVTIFFSCGCCGPSQVVQWRRVQTPASAGDVRDKDSIPGFGTTSGEENGNLLH